MKNQRGITLVALVITIIILIILSAVTMSALLSENGLITKAREGVARYGEKQNEEEEFFKNFNLDNLNNQQPNPSNPELVDWKILINALGINASNYNSFQEALFDSNNTATIIADGNCQDYILNDNQLLDVINDNNTVKTVFLSDKSMVTKLRNKVTIASNDQIGLVPTLINNGATSDTGVTCGAADQSSWWYTTSRKAYAAFNGNTTDNSADNCWQATDSESSTGAFISYWSATKDTILSARVGTWDNNPNNSDKTWTTYVRGSNDGTNWVKISENKVLSVESNNVKYFDYTITDFRPYQHYEVYFDAQDGDAQYVHSSNNYSCCFMFLQFYGIRDEDLLQYYLDNSATPEDPQEPQEEYRIIGEIETATKGNYDASVKVRLKDSNIEENVIHSSVNNNNDKEYTYFKLYYGKNGYNWGVEPNSGCELYYSTNENMNDKQELSTLSWDYRDDVKYYIINKGTFYNITYNFDGGTGGKIDYYADNASDFTLPIPKKDGYYFLGWTGSNGSVPQREVTITKGSTGNKSYTANWTAASLTTIGEVQTVSTGGSPAIVNIKIYSSDIDEDVSHGSVDGNKEKDYEFFKLTYGRNGIRWRIATNDNYILYYATEDTNVLNDCTLIDDTSPLEWEYYNNVHYYIMQYNY